MLDPQSLAHLDRVSEGLPGPFSSRHGLGHLFAITEKSLFDYGWDSTQTDALLRRLLPQNLVHPWVQTDIYRTNYADPGYDKRILVFARLNPDEAAQPAVQQEFLQDVAAIQNLLATLGFIAPSAGESLSAHAAVSHPSRYRPGGRTTDTVAHEQGSGHHATVQNAVTLSSQASAALGTAAARLKTCFTVEKRRTETQSAHHGDKTESGHTQDYAFTGFENTAIVLDHIRARLKLRSPAELAKRTTENVLRNQSYLEHHPPQTGPVETLVDFYRDLRITGVRLGQMAGLLLAQDQAATGDPQHTLTQRLASQGYVCEPFGDMIQTAGVMDWRVHPYREMAFHLLIYAALYHGAARRTEQWVTSRYALALQDVAKKNPGQEIPDLIVLADKGVTLSSDQWRPMVPQDLALIGPGTPLPPFPMFLGKTDPESPSKTTWAMVPEAVSRYGGWCTLDPAHNDSLACPDYQPVHTPEKALDLLPEPLPGHARSRLQEICSIEGALRALQRDHPKTSPPSREAEDCAAYPAPS